MDEPEPFEAEISKDMIPDKEVFEKDIVEYEPGEFSSVVEQKLDSGEINQGQANALALHYAIFKPMQGKSLTTKLFDKIEEDE